MQIQRFPSDKATRLSCYIFKVGVLFENLDNNWKFISQSYDFLLWKFAESPGVERKNSL